MLTVGKAIGGGIPAGAYGMSAEFAERVLARTDLDLVDMGGVGGTLAGNALSVAAVRATLEHVLTNDAFARMTALSESFTTDVNTVIADFGLPWSIQQLGARAEYRFASPAPINGTASRAALDLELDDYLHLYLANRGILLTPFHNMALMCPDTAQSDVDLHSVLFRDAVKELVG
jgi:glutamate-1-semialdehyde 2,1-aminomutase